MADPFSLVKTGFCGNLTNEFDKTMKAILATENQLNQGIRVLNAEIRNITTFSPVSVVKSFTDSLDANVAKLVPDLAQFDEIAELINSCMFTKTHSMLSKPSVFIQSMSAELKRTATDGMASLARVGGTLLPEFSVSNLMGALKQQVNLFGINLMVGPAKQALNCMSAICGQSITSRAALLNSFINRYSLTGTGELDPIALLQSQGIPTTIIPQINTCYNKMSNIYSAIEGNCKAAATNLKSINGYFDED